jgi:hypothetical protein
MPALARLTSQSRWWFLLGRVLLGGEPRSSSKGARSSVGRFLWAAFVLALVTLACFRHLLAVPDGLIHAPVDRSNDALRQYAGQRILCGHLFQAGLFPVWNPFVLGGTPLLANPQAALLYPGTFLFALWPALGMVSWSLALHAWILGLGTFCLCWRMGTSFPAALLGGTLAIASPYLAGHIQEGHVPHVQAAAWFPWLWLAYETLPYKSWQRAMRDFGLVVTLLLLAGHGQETYYGFLMMGFLLLVDGVKAAWNRELILYGRKVVLLFGGVALALLLSGAQLVPQAVTLPYTVRSGKLDWREAASFSSSWKNFPQLLSPFGLGCPTHDTYRGPWNYWEGNLGLGCPALLLVILGAVAGRRCALARRAFLIAVVSLLFALGVEGKIFTWLYEVMPGVGLFRAPGRMLFWWPPALGVLAAFGAAALARRVSDVGAGSEAPGTKWWYWCVLWAVLAWLGAYWPRDCSASLSALLPRIGTPRTVSAADPVVPLLIYWGGLVAVGLVTAVALMTARGLVGLGSSGPSGSVARPGWEWAAVVVPGLALFDLVGVVRHLLFVLPPHRAFDSATAHAIRIVTQTCPVQPCRVLAVPWVLNDTEAELFGVEKLNGYDAFQFRAVLTGILTSGGVSPERVERYYDRDAAVVESMRWPTGLLDRWGVHFVVATADWLAQHFPSQEGWFRVSAHGLAGPLVVLQRALPAPRARFVPEPRPSRSSSAERPLAAIPPRLLEVSLRRPAGGLRGIWELSLSVPVSGRIWLAEPWVPGLRAWVNGRPLAVQSDEAGQVVLTVAAGKQTILLQYRPPGLLWGSMASGLGVFVVLALTWFDRRWSSLGAIESGAIAAQRIMIHRAG